MSATRGASPVGRGMDPAPGPSFDEVLARYQTELDRYAMHLTRNRTEADDLSQETWLKAYRAFGRLAGTANHRAWLYTIATNTFLSTRRRAGREGPLTAAVALAVPAAAAAGVARLEAREVLGEVARFVDGLPAKQRLALVLRKDHGLDYATIAATLQTSEGAARGNVHQALRKLRTRFSDHL